jgi:hypothetical protein
VNTSIHAPAAAVHSDAVGVLTRWTPAEEGQRALREAFLAFLDARPDACARSCVPGHLTASALVLSRDGRRVLLTLHPKVGRWVQLGGHCENEDTGLVAAALREASEESGIKGLVIEPEPLHLDVHPARSGCRPGTSTCASWCTHRRERPHSAAPSPSTCPGGRSTRCPPRSTPSRISPDLPWTAVPIQSRNEALSAPMWV